MNTDDKKKQHGLLLVGYCILFLPAKEVSDKGLDKGDRMMRIDSVMMIVMRVIS